MTELVLTDVTVDRGLGPVVSGVSLSVRPGTVTALVGPNGAGKTSLLEAVSGVIAVHTGTVQLDGVDITRAPRRRRALLGIVHVQQGRAVFPSLTVQDNIGIAARSAADFDNALAVFPELSKRLLLPAAVLSGGEQQMVVLARAMAARPKVLLIDEMSLGLAPVIFLRLLPIVREIAQSGVGVLLVEQFAQHALSISTDAAVISGGTVSYSGPADALIEDPDLLVKVYLG